MILFSYIRIYSSHSRKLIRNISKTCALNHGVLEVKPDCSLKIFSPILVFDKRTCIYNLVNSISTTCEINGSTKL